MTATLPSRADQVILGNPHIRQAATDLSLHGFRHWFPDTGGVVLVARAGLFVVRVFLSMASPRGCCLDMGFMASAHADGEPSFRPWSIEHDGTPDAVARQALAFFRVADQCA